MQIDLLFLKESAQFVMKLTDGDWLGSKEMVEFHERTIAGSLPSIEQLKDFFSKARWFTFPIHGYEGCAAC